MACIDLHDTGQNSLSTYGFSKIADTPTKTHWSRAQFQKGQLIPCKTRYAFLHSPPV